MPYGITYRHSRTTAYDFGLKKVENWVNSNWKSRIKPVGEKMRIFSVILALIFALSCGVALAEPRSDKWQYQLTPFPYAWLLVIEGNLKYNLPPGSGSPNISIGPTDWLDFSNFGGVVSGSARKRGFAIFSDLVVLRTSSNNNGRVVSVEDTVTIPGTRTTIPVSAALNLNTQTELDGIVWMLAGGYALKEPDTTTLDVFAGLRFFGVDVESNWNLTAAITTPGGEVVLPAQGSIKRGTDLWDGIVGIRGHLGIGAGLWSVPYYFDVGTGSSQLTWNAMAGLAYTFKWGEIFAVYRHLEYDQNSDSLLQDFSFSGPTLGASFDF
ncbi:MAG: hypothetical protein O6946_05370 [Gammaproteobacteria bacterium]|nr:hypothetical protein [Gammaproteobacteria bacterium]